MPGQLQRLSMGAWHAWIVIISTYTSCTGLTGMCMSAWPRHEQNALSASSAGSLPFPLQLQDVTQKDLVLPLAPLIARER